MAKAAACGLPVPVDPEFPEIMRRNRASITAQMKFIRLLAGRTPFRFLHPIFLGGSKGARPLPEFVFMILKQKQFSPLSNTKQTPE